MAKKKSIRKKTVTKRRFPANIINSRLRAVVTVLLVAALGIYLLVFTSALNNNSRPADNPGRGLHYGTLHYETSGPCADGEISDKAANGMPSCAHLDPGPEGVDVRQRNLHVEQDSAKEVAYDKAHPPRAADAPADGTVPTVGGGEDVLSAGSLGAVSPRAIQCSGTGADGRRVQLMYVYSSTKTNRINYLYPYFVGYAQRMNAVMYNSGVNGGGARLIRFVTNSASPCGLSVRTLAVTGDINSASNIQAQLKSHGFSSNSRKYLTWVDGGTNCGYGANWADSSASATNYNNTYTNYAYVWHPCWNYGEPHELMHTLGAVQLNSPHHTSHYHCYDQHDVMCYNDGSGIAMKIVCSTSYVWIYDCNHDDYFAPKPVAGSYIATHWNIANSDYVYP